MPNKTLSVSLSLILLLYSIPLSALNSVGSISTSNASQAKHQADQLFEPSFPETPVLDPGPMPIHLEMSSSQDPGCINSNKPCNVTKEGPPDMPKVAGKDKEDRDRGPREDREEKRSPKKTKTQSPPGIYTPESVSRGLLLFAGLTAGIGVYFGWSAFGFLSALGNPLSYIVAGGVALLSFLGLNSFVWSAIKTVFNLGVGNPLAPSHETDRDHALNRFFRLMGYLAVKAASVLVLLNATGLMAIPFSLPFGIPTMATGPGQALAGWAAAQVIQIPIGIGLKIKRLNKEKADREWRSYQDRKTGSLYEQKTDLEIKEEELLAREQALLSRYGIKPAQSSGAGSASPALDRSARRERIVDRYYSKLDGCYSVDNGTDYDCLWSKNSTIERDIRLHQQRIKQRETALIKLEDVIKTGQELEIVHELDDVGALPQDKPCAAGLSGCGGLEVKKNAEYPDDNKRILEIYPDLAAPLPFGLWQTANLEEKSPGATTRGFQGNADPGSGYFHKGLDINAPRGTVILSRAKGEVVFADYYHAGLHDSWGHRGKRGKEYEQEDLKKGLGNVIAILPEGFNGSRMNVLQHLGNKEVKINKGNKAELLDPREGKAISGTDCRNGETQDCDSGIYVQAGQRVRSGTVLGTVGNTGKVTGNLERGKTAGTHLHWATIDVDPKNNERMRYLKEGRWDEWAQENSPGEKGKRGDAPTQQQKYLDIRRDYFKSIGYEYDDTTDQPSAKRTNAPNQNDIRAFLGFANKGDYAPAFMNPWLTKSGRLYNPPPRGTAGAKPEEAQKRK
ncbi:MAG: hypothetical protein HY401_06200 [Elusimicrobia bacterium]|nr:hypothetical protein [Elusimicrobiota bacterium]